MFFNEKGIYGVNSDISDVIKNSNGGNKLLFGEIIKELPDEYNNNDVVGFINFPSSGIFGNKVYASNNYLEGVNMNGLLNKNLLDNTKCFLEPGNENNVSNIIIGTDPLLNILNLYYVDTHFVNENIVKDADVYVVTSSNTPITYTVNYDSVINNVQR